MQTYTGLRGLNFTGTSFLTRGYALNLQVKIPEFDEVFNECKKPLNTIVKLNNELYAYLDGVKIRAFCLMGQSKITLTLEVSAPRTSLAGVHLPAPKHPPTSADAQFSSSIHRLCFPQRSSLPTSFALSFPLPAVCTILDCLLDSVISPDDKIL
jgi:hypothetical protein